MRTRIERLRVWLLASAGLLLIVIVGFIGTARYVRRHWLAAMPQKLGVNVKVDTSGITWSHTYQGQTDFVIHAAKDVEHTDGTFALRDVWVKLCGRQQKRADMVRGDEWEWNQKTGVLRAMGVVHIELRDGGRKLGCTATDDLGTGGSKDAKTMLATTSNLIYMQKLGVAATSAPIEFETGKMQGHAVGADYASDSGTLMLHSAVSMKGISAGQPVEVEAASAELDGQNHVARLTGARYTTGTGDDVRTATAEKALLHLRADQTLARIEAQSNVTMQAGGGTVSAEKVDMGMNAAGHPMNALLTGNVRYAMESPLTERRGEAHEAAITFDGKASPQPEHAVFSGAVHFAEKVRGAANAAWSTRDLTAAKLDVVLAPGADGKNQARDAEAMGSARVTEINTGKGAVVAASGSETTEIAADDLKAHFVGSGSGNTGSGLQLETIAGRGHTFVRKVSANGIEQTTAGDTLDARFRQTKAGKAKKSPAKGGNAVGESLADQLASAVQAGHVVATRKDPGKSGKAGVQQAAVREARAQRASYDGDKDRLTLDGAVQMTDAGSLLRANQVVLEDATGNAEAIGEVKAEYAETATASEKSAEPMHVLAERAELDHATDVVTFHGAPVRMWQGGSQVQAPVIEVGRTAKRLVARGDNAVAASTGQVHTILMKANALGGGDESHTATAGSPQPCATDSAAGKAKPGVQQAKSDTVRVTSGVLEYTEALHEADFTGGFRADMSGGTVRANSGAVYLKHTKSAEKTADAAQDGAALADEVDRIVASGRVAVDRPGLRATGERLVYTAADDTLLLTGDSKSAPKALDVRGNLTTGAALEFHRACDATGGDTVEVLNTVPGEPAVPAGGVHTEVQAEAKRDQPKR